MKEEDKCKNCKGEKIIMVEKTLEVAIESGCPNEHDYIFTGENDEYVRNFLYSLASSLVIFTSASRSKSTLSSKDEELILSTSKRFLCLKHSLESVSSSLILTEKNKLSLLRLVRFFTTSS